MLSILFLTFTLFYGVRRVLRERQSGLSKKIFIILLIVSATASILALLFLQLEIYEHNGKEGTIGTDAYGYFSKARDLASSEDNVMSTIKRILASRSESTGYVLISYLTFLTTPARLRVAEMLKIVNILVMLNALLLIYRYVLRTVQQDSFLSERTATMSLFLISLNGAMILTSIRVFKDMFLLLFVFAFFDSLSDYRITRAKLLFARIVFYALVCELFRPFLSGVLFLSLIIDLFAMNRIKELRTPSSRSRSFLMVMVLLVVVLGASLLVSQIVPPINSFVEARVGASQRFYRGEDPGALRSSYYAMTGRNIAIRTALGFTRFVILPDAFRSIFLRPSYDVSWYVGNIGNILEILWQLLFIPTFSALLLIILMNRSYLLLAFLSLFSFNFGIVSVYSVIYAGASQARWKLFLIILACICFSIFITKATRRDYERLFIISWVFAAIQFIWSFLFL